MQSLSSQIFFVEYILYYCILLYIIFIQMQIISLPLLRYLYLKKEKKIFLLIPLCFSGHHRIFQVQISTFSQDERYLQPLCSMLPVLILDSWLLTTYILIYSTFFNNLLLLLLLLSNYSSWLLTTAVGLEGRLCACQIVLLAVGLLSSCWRNKETVHCCVLCCCAVAGARCAGKGRRQKWQNGKIFCFETIMLNTWY